MPRGTGSIPYLSKSFQQRLLLQLTLIFDLTEILQGHCLGTLFSLSAVCRHFFHFQFVHGVYIDVHGRRNVNMAKNILNYFQINARLTQPSSEGVSENMAAKVRQKDGIKFKALFQQNLIITIPCNPLIALFRLP